MLNGRSRKTNSISRVYFTQTMHFNPLSPNRTNVYDLQGCRLQDWPRSQVQKPGYHGLFIVLTSKSFRLQEPIN